MYDIDDENGHIARDIHIQRISFNVFAVVGFSALQKCNNSMIGMCSCSCSACKRNHPLININVSECNVNSTAKYEMR